MDLTATLFDAAIAAAVGLVFALVTMRLARAQRGNMLRMSATLAAGVIALAVVHHLGASAGGDQIVAALRELALLVVAFAFIRVIGTFVFSGLFGRKTVPRILADVMIALLLVAYALYRMHVVGVNLASILTTSAVITGVIAFSLQETLGNLWSGIAIQVDNTCRLGDWIRMEGATGQIVGIRWRAVAIATNDGETIMIPNTQLIKNRVTVLARRGDLHTGWRRHVEILAGYDAAPAKVVQAIDEALAGADTLGVAREPAPICTCLGFTEQAVRYEVLYWLTDPALDLQTDSRVRTQVCAALARQGFAAPLPRRVLLTPRTIDDLGARNANLAAADRQVALARLQLFAPLTAEERTALAQTMASVEYVAGEVISHEGETADSLYILAEGEVTIHRRGGATGRERILLDTLQAPHYFGEMGLLTGQPRTATVTAVGNVLCYRLDKSAFDTVIRARPELAQALAQVLATRLAANEATLLAWDEAARRDGSKSIAGEVLRRMRAFFHLPG